MILDVLRSIRALQNGPIQRPVAFGARVLSRADLLGLASPVVCGVSAMETSLVSVPLAVLVRESYRGRHLARLLEWCELTGSKDQHRRSLALFIRRTSDCSGTRLAVPHDMESERARVR